MQVQEVDGTAEQQAGGCFGTFVFQVIFSRTSAAARRWDVFEPVPSSAISVRCPTLNS